MEQSRGITSSVKTLGEYLASARQMKGLSLRKVEAAIAISNAYLSQLENNRVQQPSPGVLQKLSKLYGIRYVECLRIAGYPIPEEQGFPR